MVQLTKNFHVSLSVVGQFVIVFLKDSRNQYLSRFDQSQFFDPNPSRGKRFAIISHAIRLNRSRRTRSVSATHHFPHVCRLWKSESSQKTFSGFASDLVVSGENLVTLSVAQIVVVGDLARRVPSLARDVPRVVLTARVF